MSPPPAEVPDFRGMFREAIEAVREETRHENHADDMLSALGKLAEREPPPPPKAVWTDWLRSSLLPMVVLAAGGFAAYYHDQAATAKAMADMSRNLDVISQRLDRDERDTSDRVKELVPVIRSNEMLLKRSDLIDQQQNERMETMAQSILQLRATVETLGQAVSKTHEDLMIDRARRGDKESRLTPRRDPPPTVLGSDLH